MWRLKITKKKKNTRAKQLWGKKKKKCKIVKFNYHTHPGIVFRNGLRIASTTTPVLPCFSGSIGFFFIFRKFLSPTAVQPYRFQTYPRHSGVSTSDFGRANSSKFPILDVTTIATRSSVNERIAAMRT